MFEVLFLVVLASIFILFAVFQDLKSREIANWLNWGLIIFALGFRFFFSLFGGEWNFFLQGLIGFGIFFGLGNLFYYSKIFAGGDAKLMIALGTILPFTNTLIFNLKIFVLFLFCFLAVGAIYGLAFMIGASIKNWRDFKKEFYEQLRKNIWFFSGLIFVSILILALSFFNFIFIWLGILFFILPYLYIYAKSVDESCMIRELGVSKLTEGDWLYKDVKVKGKIIKATWDGLSLEDISLLKKYKKKVLVRYGFQYAPVFLISFLFLIFGWFLGILEEIWFLFF